MRKGTKAAVITGVIFGIAGTACVITGLVLGATWKDVGSAVRSSLDLRHTSWGHEINEEIMDWVDGSRHEEEYSDHRGIDYYGGIRSLEVDAGLCDVYIYGAASGSDSTVGVERLEGKAYVEKSGDTLEIEASGSIGQSGSLGLYLPAAGLERLEIDAGSGNVIIDETSVREADLQVAAGNLEVSGTLSAETADLEVGLGSMTIGYLDAQNITVDCGLGSFIATAAGREQDYSFKGDCGLGNLEFGSNVYSGISDVKIGSQDSARQLKVSCGAGNAQIYLAE